MNAEASSFGRSTHQEGTMAQVGSVSLGPPMGNRSLRLQRVARCVSGTTGTLTGLPLRRKAGRPARWQVQGTHQAFKEGL